MSKYHPRIKLDITQARIEAFNEEHGGGVAIRKARDGYSLFCEDTGVPVARLRPVGAQGKFEILRWSSREKWEPVGELGGVHLPLDAALEFIADDPMDCFWR